MKIRNYWRVGYNTTLNIILYAASRGDYLWLEGRVRRGVFRNWALDFPYTPPTYVKPSTEEGIVQIVGSFKKVRVFGSAHSFNEGVKSDQVLISMDNYSGLVSEKDLAKKQITVKGGTRVRDVVKLLAQYGLAFPALPSHDAQSIAGVLSTDVHGTSADPPKGGPARGFISDSVVRLKLLDGTGAIIECEPKDDLFKAAIGGLGAVGVILEVTVQGVDRFNINQQVEMRKLDEVKENLDKLIACNDHFSIYVFPFTKECQVNTWNHTNQPHSRNALIREFSNISRDALLAAWVGGLLADTKLLRLSKVYSRFSYLVRRGSNLVLESNYAFNRTIYHLHQELEFTVPYEKTFDVCECLIKRYKEMYSERRAGLPYTLFELRFTPAGHDCTLIGAGQERRSTWIDIVSNDSDGFEEYYAEALRIIKKEGGRPHLGKYTNGFDRKYLQRLYGDHFEKFRSLMVQHDPDRKFSNTFIKGLLG